MSLWLIVAGIAMLASAAVVARRRGFRLKTVRVKVPGAELEFERDRANSPAPASGITQEVIAAPGGSIHNAEQNAAG
ncbi:MAG: hypothetical protein ONB56_02705 [candidate division KSB1 bacterium]|nr:hypothetical protein [candidate division KSB1 bacterium]MDZ7394747.1 hypothetical protein [candidate division KSB1 bacterium]